jgi:iron complex outermembrane recepter protein
MRASHAVMRARVWAPLLAGALVLGLAPFASADSSTPAGKGTVPAGKGTTTPTAPKAADNSGSKSPYSGVEEIVVMARKRAENMQATPVAISAFTDTDLVDKDIRRVQEVGQTVPTLQFDNAVGQANSARVYLRGVGNGDPISSDDPGVGVYIDGVFLPRAQGALLTVSDIAQVEVLRGPQGTLFGKNTIGGAVNITTRKPDAAEFSSQLEARVGNFHRYDSRVSVNVPLVEERSAVRFSFATSTRDPITKNKSTGRDFQDDKLLGGRFQFMWAPSDASELNFSFDQGREHRVLAGGKCIVTNRRPNFNGGANGTEQSGGADLNGDGIIQNQAAAASFAAVNGVAIASQGAILASLATNQNQNNFLNTCDQDMARDERSVASDLTSSKDYLDTWGSSLVFQQDLSDELVFKSISAWRRNLNETRIDNDFTQLNFAQASIDAGDGNQVAYSQEFQFNGSAVDDRLKYVFGLYAFKEEIDENAFGGLSTMSPFVGAGTLGFRVDPNNQNEVISQTFGTAANANAAIVTSFNSNNAAFGFPGVTFLGGASYAAPGAVTNTVRKVNNHGYAVFTQGTYDLTDSLALTVGARLTSEAKRVSAEIFATTGGFVGAAVRRPGEIDFAFERSARFKDISPLVNLAWQLSDEAMVYATFSKGFKSGGFNGRANNNVLTNQIDDEKLNSYELGFKSDLLDNKLRVNGSTYWSLYRDIQLTIPRGINGQASIDVVNAGKAEIKGAELEIVAQLMSSLELTAAMGAIHSRYVRFRDPSNAFAKDRRLLATPTYTGNFGATYALPSMAFGDVRVHSEWIFRGRSGTDVVDSRELRKAKSGELDASITLTLPDGKTDFVVFGSNLLNREYFVNGVNLGDSLGIAYRFYNEPRQYGFEVRRRF